MMKSPLPVRNGVGATRLHIPAHSDTAKTVGEYLRERFPHVAPASLAQRFDDGEVVDAAGEAVADNTALSSVEFIWYYRTVAEEKPIPFEITVLHVDEHLVVADKPHFLPTTPGGRFVQETALVRLRNQLGCPELTPLHRLDRDTAGLLLFSPNPATRGAFQTMFENRAISRTYQAVSLGAVNPARFPLVYRNRIIKTKGIITAETMDYAVTDSGRLPPPRTGKQRRRTDPTRGPNAMTHIDLVSTGVSRGAWAGYEVSHFRLRPFTGRTHQLRIHLAALGAGIANDRLYPTLQPDGDDDVQRPLQLLCDSLSFADPLTGQPRQFNSQRQLSEAP